tara:strand:+ start:281 stop:904 length:624 start_codon:yes stop_codon:yes gene_type:complete
MESADYDITEMALGSEHGPQGLNGNNPYKQEGDEQLFVRFFQHPRQNQTKSAEEGRPIYEEIPYIEIMQPGNKESVISRAVRKAEQLRFPKQWDAFVSGVEQSLEGTPLEQWSALNRSQVEELRFFNVRTVEQLANMSDAHAQNFAGIQSMKQKAVVYLELAKGEVSDATSIVARMEALEAQLEAEKENKMVLQARVEELEAEDNED